MPNDPNQGGMSPEAAANAGRQSAQNGAGLAPQQPGESMDTYNQRVNAYNQEKNKGTQQ